MSFDTFFACLLAALDSVEAPYMIVGSLASLTYGEARQTRGVDVVIDVDEASVVSLVRALSPSEWYADEDAAVDAVRRRRSFNIIHQTSFWKADLIVRPATRYDVTAFARRLRRPVQGHMAWVSSPEDVIIAKLRWSAQTGSDRQLQDVAGVLRVQNADLDLAYVEQWIADLRLEDRYAQARALVGLR